MSNVKGRGQRLIPEELLRYLEAFKENHPDPTEGGGATLDDIIDSNGNKRFIEGDGQPGDLNALESSYCKWSLSGTHLMCVLAGKLKDGVSVTGGSVLATFKVPNYILNKIIPVWGEHLESRTVSLNTILSTTSYCYVFIDKTLTELKIVTDGTFTPSYDRYFRIQFDLLIDSE